MTQTGIPRIIGIIAVLNLRQRCLAMYRENRKQNKTCKVDALNSESVLELIETNCSYWIVSFLEIGISNLHLFRERLLTLNIPEKMVNETPNSIVSTLMTQFLLGNT